MPMKAKKSEQDPNIENILCEIPLISKLKTNRGLQYLRRLIKICEYLEIPQNEIIENKNKQTYLILLVEGEIQITYEHKKRDGISKQIRNKKMYKNSHCVVDATIFKFIAVSNVRLYLVREKYILDLFQGILEFPYLVRRFKELRSNELFDNLQRRVISKIAFDLEELSVPIGASIFPREYKCDHEECIKYFYLIISGQIKIFRNATRHKKPVCVLGPYEIFGDFSQESQALSYHGIQVNKLHQSQDYYGVVITQTAELYKIKVQNFVKSLGPYIQYENKRQKWRQSRLNHINQNLKFNQTYRKQSKKKMLASFLDKQIAFKSFYGNNTKQLCKMKQFFGEQELKCENREQFYGKKLDRILSMQKQRYGNSKDIVLFPIAINRIPINKKGKSLTRTLTSTPKSYNSTLRTPVKTQASQEPKSPQARRSKRILTQPSKNWQGLKNSNLYNFKKQQ